MKTKERERRSVHPAKNREQKSGLSNDHERKSNDLKRRETGKDNKSIEEIPDINKKPLPDTKITTRDQNRENTNDLSGDSDPEIEDNVDRF